MFDLSLSNILHSNLFNFILLVIILYSLTAPILKKSIKSMNEKTVRIVDKSVQDKEDAIKNLEDAKKSYSEISKEKDEINEIAKNTINSLKRKSEEDIEDSKKIIENNLNKSLQTESSKILSELTSETVNNSLIQAAEKIKTKLEQDENLHNVLIEQAIDKLEII